MKFMNIITRIKEPSTWAGIAALGMLVGLPPGTIDAVGQLIGAAGAIGAILLKEKADA